MQQGPKSPYSAKFKDDMTAIRLAALQTALLKKPELVLDLLAFGLSTGNNWGNDTMAVRFDNQRNKPEGDDVAFVLDRRLGGSLADDEQDALDDREVGDVQTKAERFAAYREGGKKTRNAQITEVFARSFKTQETGFMELIEGEIDADIRAIWTPNALNCFKRLKGWQLDTIFMTLLDLASDNVTYLGFMKLKKGEKNAKMEALFSDADTQKFYGLTVEQKAKIDAWVPECFD